MTREPDELERYLDDFGGRLRAARADPAAVRPREGELRMKRVRILPGALGAAAAVAAAAAVISGVAAADDPEPVRVSALKERPPAQLSPAVARSPSLAEFDAAPGKARSVRAPAGQTGTWALMPADDGACLVAPSDAIVCAPAKNVNAGMLLSFRAPNAFPEQLSPSQLEDAQAGKPIQGWEFSLAGSTVTGVAPDEAVAVALLSSDGQTIAKASVVDNLYGVSNVDMSAVATVRLIHADGTSTDSE